MPKTVGATYQVALQRQKETKAWLALAVKRSTCTQLRLSSPDSLALLGTLTACSRAFGSPSHFMGEGAGGWGSELRRICRCTVQASQARLIKSPASAKECRGDLSGRPPARKGRRLSFDEIRPNYG